MQLTDAMVAPVNDNRPPDDAPLRLKDAAAIAFPRGGMTESGLRQEHAKGRLNLELIAGKHFVTLAEISKMRKLCRVEVQAHACGGIRLENRGRSSIGSDESARDAVAEKMRRRRLASRRI